MVVSELAVRMAVEALDVSGQRKKAVCVPWPVTALVSFGMKYNKDGHCQASANSKDANVAA